MDVNIHMPDIGLDEVEVIEILVQKNERIVKEQEILVVEGDKASIEIPSTTSGIIKDIYVQIGDKIKTSSLLMKVISEGNDLQNPAVDVHTLKHDVKEFTNSIEKVSSVHATPLIRRLARNLNIDLNKVTATGPKSRILKEDIDNYRKKINLNIKRYTQEKTLDQDVNLNVNEVELSHLQQKTGNRLHNNWINIPHVTHFDEANITILEKFRQKYNNEHANKNITILVFILKIVAYSLKKFPIFNSSLDSNKKKIIIKKHINIGVAVAVEKGLLVPVLKNVDQKNIKELSCELISLSEKSRKGDLNVSELKNGSFTISNLGSVGSGWFSPIVNAPEVAILGVSKAQIKPLWDGNKFIPSLMLPLSLSYDHRVINGADAARFMTFVIKLLSDIHFLVM